VKARHLLAFAAVMTIAIATLAPSAWAAGGGGNGGSGSGSLGPGGVGSGAGAQGGVPVSYTTPAPNPPASTQSGYTWSDMGADLEMACTNGKPTPLPPIVGANGPGTGQSLGPPGAAGFAELYVLTGPNGAIVSTQDACPGAAPAAVPLPPPPTPAEVWAATPLPPSHIDFSPSTLGLTQLATWMWFTGPGGTVTATVTIRGYTVTTTAHPVAAYWWFGDGTSGEGPIGGSEAQPSATHTYVNVGHYIVTLIVAWSGQYTFAGNGVPAETVQLGTVDGPATAVPYGVQEVRSVGVTPESSQ